MARSSVWQGTRMASAAPKALVAIIPRLGGQSIKITSNCARASTNRSRSARRAPETVGGCSGCGSEWGGLNIVGGHGRIPGCEQVVERAVEGSGLQEEVGPFPRPL